MSREDSIAESAKQRSLRVALDHYQRPNPIARVKLWLSLLAAVVIWYFFMHMRGWTPPAGEEVDYSTYVHWFLLGYLAIQLIVLIPTSAAGSTGEVWLDTCSITIHY